MSPARQPTAREPGRQATVREPAAREPAAREARRPVDTQVAARVWRGMRALVLERYDRRKEVTEALDMSFVRAKALRQLAAGPLTMRQLAAGLATDPPYTTVVVDDLERRGFVERTAHPSDRRSKIVTMTAAGVRAARAAERILNAPPAPVVELSATDLAALDRIVAKLLAAPGADAPDAGAGRG